MTTEQGTGFDLSPQRISMVRECQWDNQNSIIFSNFFYRVEREESRCYGQLSRVNSSVGTALKVKKERHLSPCLVCQQ